VTKCFVADPFCKANILEKRVSRRGNHVISDRHLRLRLKSPYEPQGIPSIYSHSLRIESSLAEFRSFSFANWLESNQISTCEDPIVLIYPLPKVACRQSLPLLFSLFLSVLLQSINNQANCSILYFFSICIGQVASRNCNMKTWRFQWRSEK
jgi:hypothetical protein